MSDFGIEPGDATVIMEVLLDIRRDVVNILELLTEDDEQDDEDA